jgi:hypothetical protein
LSQEEQNKAQLEATAQVENIGLDPATLTGGRGVARLSFGDPSELYAGLVCDMGHRKTVPLVEYIRGLEERSMAICHNPEHGTALHQIRAATGRVPHELALKQQFRIMTVAVAAVQEQGAQEQVATEGATE